MVNGDISITCNNCYHKIDIGYKNSGNFSCPNCEDDYFLAIYDDFIRIRRYKHFEGSNSIIFNRTYFKW